MDTGRVLPRNANYMEHLPLAMSSQSKRRNYFQVNGQTFTSTGNNIIRIDISGDSFLDTKNSYLTFRYVNNTGQAMANFVLHNGKYYDCHGNAHFTSDCEFVAKTQLYDYKIGKTGRI